MCVGTAGPTGPQSDALRSAAEPRCRVLPVSAGLPVVSLGWSEDRLKTGNADDHMYADDTRVLCTPAIQNLCDTSGPTARPYLQKVLVGGAMCS